MASEQKAPIIVKRRKVVKGGGHHGGAWKVAYADFVTAMMAFFLLMWLLSVTSETMRHGIADYFSPSVPISRNSAGGEGMFGGEDPTYVTIRGVSGSASGMRSADTVAPGESPEEAAAAAAAEQKALEDLAEKLNARSGESATSDDILNHVITRLTDEGLVVELFDLDEAPLFEPGTATPAPLLGQLAQTLAEVFALVENDVAIAAHVRAQPVVVAANQVWPLSTARADAIRTALEGGGLAPARLRRLTGHGDRDPAVSSPMATRNNRIELILLRADR